MSAGLITFADVAELPPQEPCKGAFVRYRETAFINGRGIKMTREFYELKRISCEGCRVCDSIWETIFESGADSVELDEALQHGDTASLGVVVDSTDWESGHADDWHVVATKVVPNSTKSN